MKSKMKTQKTNEKTATRGTKVKSQKATTRGTKVKIQKATPKPVSIFALRSELQAAHAALLDLVARIEHMIDRGAVPTAMPLEFAEARRSVRAAMSLH